MQLEEGQIIEGLRGRFQIRRRCGDGGFGVTFEGVDELGRAVAVKQLRFDRLRDWKALELFEREGRVLEHLAHPNIPAYIDFFAHDGQGPFPPAQASSRQGGGVSWFLVQQFVPGTTLQHLIDHQARLHGEQLASILASLLATLDYLHSLHPPVIHRDINPKNILLDPDGRPFLVDFGAIQDRLRFEQGSTSVGTMGYMPLEQIRGMAQPSSDLYALGMTMLALASGSSPSAMPVDEATGKTIVDRVAPGLPPRVRFALDRMVEPIAGKRVGSAVEALAALSSPVTPGRRSPAATLAVAAVGSLLAVGGGALLLARGPSQVRGPAFRPPVVAPASPVIATTAATAAATTASTARPVVLSRPVSLVWKAKVATATGKALAPGAPCEILVDGSSSAQTIDASRVVARCGAEVLFDSSAALEGTSMMRQDIREIPVAGKVGVFSYQLQFSDVGTRVGERAQATLDTTLRQAVLFREAVPLYRVTLDVDPSSAVRQGEPFLALTRPPFDRVVERKGKVIEADGKSPARVGAPCQLAISPAYARGHTCRATLVCGGRRLYGAQAGNGFASCTLDGNMPTGFFDPGSDNPEDDPETRVDLPAGSVTLREQRGAAFTMKIRLDP